MKTGALLLRVRKVKGRAGFLVVDVPDGAVILPRHTRPEKGFKMDFEPDDGAPEKFKRAGALLGASG